MPKKTKKEKIRATQRHATKISSQKSLAVKGKQVLVTDAHEDTKRVDHNKQLLSEKNPFISSQDNVFTNYFKRDLSKSVVVTGIILTLEVIIYIAFQNGIIPSLPFLSL